MTIKTYKITAKAGAMVAGRNNTGNGTSLRLDHQDAATKNALDSGHIRPEKSAAKKKTAKKTDAK